MNETPERTSRADDVSEDALDDDHTVSGDPVCWMHLLCPECGVIPTAASPDRCWQCGAPRT